MTLGGESVSRGAWLDHDCAVILETGSVSWDTCGSAGTQKDPCAAKALLSGSFDAVTCMIAAVASSVCVY